MNIKKRQSRKHIPQSLRELLLLEVGLKCPVPKCTHEDALEVHHIDNDPGNNNPINLLILCSFHHSQATYGKLSKRMCKRIKEDILDFQKKSFSGVKYFHEEDFDLLDSRTSFFNEAIRILKTNPTIIRIMLVGPVFLHPEWVFKARDIMESRPSFAKEFKDYIFNNLSSKRDIRIMLNNTYRYRQIVNKFVSINNLERFKNDILSTLTELINGDVERSIRICCLDPGFYEMVFISEKACLETSRETIDTPVKGGLIYRSPNYVVRQIDKYDRIYDSAFKGLNAETDSLRNFIISL